MFPRNAVTRPRQRMTSELNEGLHHLGKAAKSGGQVAMQTYAAARPHIDNAVAKLPQMPSNGRKTAKKRGQQQRRWPLTMVALAGGLVIGGAASLLSKRRHEQQDDPFATMETHPAN